jgi:hypothetical protein
MKLSTKTIVAIAVVLFVLLTGGHFFSSHRPTLMPPQQAMNPYGAFGSPAGAMPDMSKIAEDQAKLVELMNNYHLGLKAANYIAQAKLQVLEQTDTSIHFVLSYPDKAKIDETMSVAADPNYVPSAADLERAARTGSKVHGPKLTVKQNGQKEWQYTLEYHVPYSAVPSDLLQKIQPSTSSQNRRAHFFDLVPTVRADGGLPAGELSVSVLANYFAAYYEEEMPGRSIGVDVPLALADLGDDFLTLRNWLNEIDELEKCAKNPTNPLSQKATQDPNYQHDVLDPLSDAKIDVGTTFVPMLASDTAGFVTHWMPFGSGAAVGLIFSTQDDAVSQITENRIQEAQKYVVPCEDAPMTPGDLRPMEGVLKYTFVNKQPPVKPELEDTRKAEGKFELNIVQGGLGGRGTAKFTRDYQANSTNPQCKGIAESLKATGDVDIDAQGGGTPFGGVIELHFGGDVPVADAQMVSNGANNCTEQTKTWTEHYGAVCRFQHVDMVHGGTFSTFSQEDGGYGTCTIELSRK